MNDLVLSRVKAKLEASRGQWPKISEQTKVPYFTITNIVSGKSVNPRIGSLQPLMDYFGITIASENEEAAG